MTTVLHARPRNFVNTPAIERIITRALRYLQSGFPVHLRGPAGTGKTTLALHLADLLSRPIMLLFGDDEFKSTDLIGNQSGYTRKKVVDNFIHSVVKMEDELRHNWVDSRLTLACREGFTLVYDEFNRSRPEVNNVLLSALEEKLLVLPPNSNRNEYIRVNPHFRAIFTSNPEEYCGVHATQDALLDRLITINVPEPDELTQQEIVIQKIGIDRQSAATIVQLLKRFRQKVNSENSSGLRSCLMISKICHEHGIVAATENAEFRDLCQDIMLSRSGLPARQATQIMWETFNELVGADIAPCEPTDHLIDAHDRESAVPVVVQVPDLESASQATAPAVPAVAEISELVYTADGMVEDADDVESAAVTVNTPEEAFEPEEPELEVQAADAFSTAKDMDLPEAIATIAESAVAPEMVVTEPLHENLTETIADEVTNAVIDAAAEAVVDKPSADLEQEFSTEALGAETSEVSLTESDAVDPDLDDFSEVPFERDVYAYLQTAENVRPSEIEAALSINRFQAINALRSLVDKGLVLAQSNAKKPSTYRLNSAPAIVH